MLEWLIQNEFFATITLITVIFTLSNFVVFQAGVFSLAAFGFYAVGAYTSSVLTTTYGQGLYTGLVASIGAGALAAAVVCLVTFRLSGIYLALATFALAQAMLGVIRGLKEVTNGVLGLFGMPLGPTLWISLAVIAVACLFFELTRRSRHGRAFQTLRTDVLLARGVGINVGAYRLAALMASGMLAALAGALNAHTIGVISPDQYNFGLLVVGLTYAVVGGVNHWAGPVVAALALGLFHHQMRNVSTEAETLIYGAILVLVVFIAPGGLGDSRLRKIAQRARPRRTGKEKVRA